MEASAAGTIVGDQPSQGGGELLEIAKAIEQPGTLISLSRVHPPLFVHYALYDDGGVIPVSLHLSVKCIHSSLGRFRCPMVGIIPHRDLVPHQHASLVGRFQ